MKPYSEKQLQEAIGNFGLEGTLLSANTYGSGHINDTVLLVYELDNKEERKVILQRMNTDIFPEPENLMENIKGVTGWLRKKIEAAGGNPDRETLNVIPALDGKAYYCDSEGDYWRVFKYITDATSFDRIEKTEHFYESAVTFGGFQGLLSDYPAETLHEAIKGFHDTAARFEVFKQAVSDDVKERADLCREDIQFVLDREYIANIYKKYAEEGKLPLRVTHNDTKLNNIMIDNKTGKGICVIDLDTVMPGYVMNDFGDSIRFGASTAAEDETDLDKVSCSMELFRVYTEGFLKGANGQITQTEIDLLPAGALVMTFECGMRFLTDYLQGDVYFKIHKENHNLDRARNQFKLVADMEAKWDEMKSIVKEVQKSTMK